MKHKLLFLFVCICLITAATSTVYAQTKLAIRLHTGEEQSYDLSSVGKLTFSGGNMLFHTKDQQSTNPYALSSIDRMSFTKTTTGIHPYEINNTMPAVYPNPATDYIYLRNLPEGYSIMSVYGVNGALAMQKLVTPSMQIDVSGLSKGIYMIRVNNQTIKFSKL